jgi:hypothetical protein
MMMMMMEETPESTDYKVKEYEHDEGRGDSQPIMK